MARAKQAMRSAYHSTLEEQLLFEREAQLEAFRSDDFREGLRAFLEKRTPRFGRAGGVARHKARGTQQHA